MPRKRYVTERRYNIDFYSYGRCYRTLMDCPKYVVDEHRATAKLIKGETIKVELNRIIKHEY